MKKIGKWLGIAALAALTSVGFAACGDKSNDVKKTVDAIASLPAVSTLSIGDASAVSDARTLYDALGEKEKEKVTNYDALISAESVMTVLYEIAELQPTFTSGNSMTAGDTYTPQITGYAYNATQTSIVYSLKNNTANAALQSGAITAERAGAFTVEAVVSYAGYNIKRNAELHVTVNEPAPPTRTLSGRLSFDAALTDSTDFTGATVKIGTYDATVQADGGWTAEVPYGTYTVTATHPAYAAKPVENFAVNADAPAPELKFTMFAARGNGNNTNVYDWENKAYNQSFGTSASGNARVSFPGFTAGANEEFVFRATMLYSENTGNNGNWKYGLALHDGSENLADSAFSLGLFLANDGGRFYACKELDKNSVSLGIQGAFFGGTKGANVPVLPTVFGEKTITLTYVRKNDGGTLKWYMIAEWDSTGDGQNDKRFVREPGDNLKAELAATDDAEIYFDLTFGVDNSNGASKCGNLYFAKGSEAVGAIDLEEGSVMYESVITAIGALPAASALTIDDASAVDAARSAYDSLTTKAKASVTNYRKLDEAETVMTVLSQIHALEVSISSSAQATVGTEYITTVAGYEYAEVATSVGYSLKDNTAGATVTADGKVTAANAGEFTIVAEISYTGYNITKRAEKTVTVVNAADPTCVLSGTLTFDTAITNAVNFTGATVKVGNFDAVEAQADGSWTVEVPYGTYTVTATHPYFVDVTAENFVVGSESTPAPELKFNMFSAHGAKAYVSDSAPADVSNSTFAYGEERGVYQVGANVPRTGKSRIDFNATTVAKGADFVFRVDLLQSTNTTTNWKYGLTVHDGNEDFKSSAFSLGIFLANDSNGRFIGFKNLDMGHVQWTQGETTNTSCGTQTKAFGADNPVALPTTFGEGKIRLTYLRKTEGSEHKWYFIAEWGFNEDGVASKRFVRQPSSGSGNLLAELNALNDKEIHLGLSLGTTDAVNGITKWGNVYFATGAGVADGVDLTTTTN